VLRTIRYLVGLGVYGLMGAIVHTWLFGPLHWDTVRTWGLVVFWPAVVGGLVTMAIISIIAVVIVIVLLWCFFGGLKGRIELARLRAETRRAMNKHRD
jgi:uncharacterized membrane protein YeaQ/YmgE (transglycosylase-associated protein family)